jgi:hypothetical protein
VKGDEVSRTDHQAVAGFDQPTAARWLGFVRAALWPYFQRLTRGAGVEVERSVSAVARSRVFRCMERNGLPHA